MVTFFKIKIKMLSNSASLKKYLDLKVLNIYQDFTLYSINQFACKTEMVIK